MVLSSQILHIGFIQSSKSWGRLNITITGGGRFNTVIGRTAAKRLRLFVALHKGLPYAAEADTLLPLSAIGMLKDKLPEKQIRKLRAITVSLSGLIPVEAQAEGRAERLDYLVRG